MNMVASDCLQQWGLYDDLLKTDCPGIGVMAFDIGDVSFATAVPGMGSIHQLHYCKRKVLDELLLKQACKEGVSLSMGTRFKSILEQDDTGVVAAIEDADGLERRVRAAFVVGADGRNSTVAKAIDAPSYDVMTERAIMCFAYYDAALTDRLDIYMRNDKSVALFPTNEGQTCLVLAYQIRGGEIEALPKEVFLSQAIADISGVMRKLEVAPEPAAVYRFNGAEGFFRQPYVGRCALVGDAGYFRDPIIGDGIADAFLSAELLAVQLSRALKEGSHEEMLAIYKEVRDRHFRQAYERTRRLLRFDYDFEGLNAKLASMPDGGTMLKKIFDQLLNGNRRSRKDLFDTLARTVLEIA